MEIALLGYGKMGKSIEKIALERGHSIVLKADRNGFTNEEISKADIAIEFSVPSAVIENIKQCAINKTPVIVGTTAWYSQYNKVCDIVRANNSAMLTATNFSIGVNIFFALNKHLATLMNQHPSYNIEIDEIHHTQKLDAPSGTAISLADDIISKIDRKNTWIHHEKSEIDNTKAKDALCLQIGSERLPKVPGTHVVSYENEIDILQIKHEAKTRDGFALGSIIAAEWLVSKKGVYTMQDVLKLNIKE